MGLSWMRLWSVSIPLQQWSQIVEVQWQDNPVGQFLPTNPRQAKVRSGVQSRHGAGQRGLLLLHQQQTGLQPCGVDHPGLTRTSSPSSHDLQYQQPVSLVDLGCAPQRQPRPHQQLQDLCQGEQPGSSSRDWHRIEWDTISSYRQGPIFCKVISSR